MGMVEKIVESLSEGISQVVLLALGFQERQQPMPPSLAHVLSAIEEAAAKMIGASAALAEAEFSACPAIQHDVGEAVRAAGEALSLLRKAVEKLCARTAGWTAAHAPPAAAAPPQAPTAAQTRATAKLDRAWTRLNAALRELSFSTVLLLHQVSTSDVRRLHEFARATAAQLRALDASVIAAEETPEAETAAVEFADVLSAAASSLAQLAEFVGARRAELEDAASSTAVAPHLDHSVGVGLDVSQAAQYEAEFQTLSDASQVIVDSANELLGFPDDDALRAAFEDVRARAVASAEMVESITRAEYDAAMANLRGLSRSQATPRSARGDGSMSARGRTAADDAEQRVRRKKTSRLRADLRTALTQLRSHCMRVENATARADVTAVQLALGDLRAEADHFNQLTEGISAEKKAELKAATQVLGVHLDALGSIGDAYAHSVEGDAAAVHAACSAAVEANFDVCRFLGMHGVRGASSSSLTVAAAAADSSSNAGAGPTPLSGRRSNKRRHRTGVPKEGATPAEIAAATPAAVDPLAMHRAALAAVVEAKKGNTGALTDLLTVSLDLHTRLQNQLDSAESDLDRVLLAELKESLSETPSIEPEAMDDSVARLLGERMDAARRIVAVAESDELDASGKRSAASVSAAVVGSADLAIAARTREAVKVTAAARRSQAANFRLADQARVCAAKAASPAARQEIFRSVSTLEVLFPEQLERALEVVDDPTKTGALDTVTESIMRTISDLECVMAGSNHAEARRRAAEKAALKLHSHLLSSEAEMRQHGVRPHALRVIEDSIVTSETALTGCVSEYRMAAITPLRRRHIEVALMTSVAAGHERRSSVDAAIAAPTDSRSRENALGCTARMGRTVDSLIGVVIPAGSSRLVELAQTVLRTSLELHALTCVDDRFEEGVSCSQALVRSCFDFMEFAEGEADRMQLSLEMQSRLLETLGSLNDCVIRSVRAHDNAAADRLGAANSVRDTHARIQGILAQIFHDFSSDVAAASVDEAMLSTAVVNVLGEALSSRSFEAVLCPLEVLPELVNLLFSHLEELPEGDSTPALAAAADVVTTALGELHAGAKGFLDAASAGSEVESSVHRGLVAAARLDAAFHALCEAVQPVTDVRLAVQDAAARLQLAANSPAPARSICGVETAVTRLQLALHEELLCDANYEVRAMFARAAERLLTSYAQLDSTDPSTVAALAAVAAEVSSLVSSRYLDSGDALAVREALVAVRQAAAGGRTAAAARRLAERAPRLAAQARAQAARAGSSTQARRVFDAAAAVDAEVAALATSVGDGGSSATVDAAAQLVEAALDELHNASVGHGRMFTAQHVIECVQAAADAAALAERRVVDGDVAAAVTTAVPALSSMCAVAAEGLRVAALSDVPQAGVRFAMERVDALERCCRGMLARLVDGASASEVRAAGESVRSAAAEAFAAVSPAVSDDAAEYSAAARRGLVCLQAALEPASDHAPALLRSIDRQVSALCTDAGRGLQLDDPLGDELRARMLAVQFAPTAATTELLAAVMEQLRPRVAALLGTSGDTSTKATLAAAVAKLDAIIEQDITAAADAAAQREAEQARAAAAEAADNATAAAAAAAAAVAPVRTQSDVQLLKAMADAALKEASDVASETAARLDVAEKAARRSAASSAGGAARPVPPGTSSPPASRAPLAPVAARDGGGRRRGMTALMFEGTLVANEAMSLENALETVAQHLLDRARGMDADVAAHTGSIAEELARLADAAKRNERAKFLASARVVAQLVSKYCTDMRARAERFRDPVVKEKMLGCLQAMLNLSVQLKILASVKASSAAANPDAESQLCVLTQNLGSFLGASLNALSIARIRDRDI